MTVVALVVLIAALGIALAVATRGRVVSVQWESRRVVWHCTGCGKPYRWDGGLGDAVPCPRCGRAPSPAELEWARRLRDRLREAVRSMDSFFREGD